MKLEIPSNESLRGILSKTALLAVLVMGAPLFAAGPTVSNVTAQQRAGTKLVDISYDLEHDTDLPSTVTIEATTDGSNWELLTELTSTGNHGFGVTEGTGKAVVWAAGEEWPAQLFPTVKIRVRANDGTGGGVEPSAFSLVPAGTFTMGSPPSELGRYTGSEKQHMVTLTNSFYVAKTEVTWDQWQSARTYALANGYSDIGTGTAGGSGSEGGSHPVTNVSWWDAVKYCNALSEQEGKTPVYYTAATFGSAEVFRTGAGAIFANLDANGYRLPTGAEWEYFCRAGTTTAFFNGEITEPTGIDLALEASGWYTENSGDNTHEVGGKLANPWDIYDAHGNVWEWCWDLYVDDLGSEAVTDPAGPTNGSNRVIRGGGFRDQTRGCRSARRFRFDPANSDATLGFRVVVTATQ